METRYSHNLAPCIQHGKKVYADVFTRMSNCTRNSFDPLILEQVDDLDWPADGTGCPNSPMTRLVTRFPPSSQRFVGDLYASGYHLGDGYVDTAGHCLHEAILSCGLHDLGVIFNWAGDIVTKRTFTTSEVFEIEW